MTIESIEKRDGIISILRNVLILVIMLGAAYYVCSLYEEEKIEEMKKRAILIKKTRDLSHELSILKASYENLEKQINEVQSLGSEATNK